MAIFVIIMSALLTGLVTAPLDNPKVSIISLSVILAILVSVIIVLKLINIVPDDGMEMSIARKWVEHARKKGYSDSYLSDMLKLHGWKKRIIKKLLKK